jgi:hypothetical protein
MWAAATKRGSSGGAMPNTIFGIRQQLVGLFLGDDAIR